MLLTPLYLLDRASGLLAAQLLSSQTAGTFQFGKLATPASALGTQSWNMPTGWKAVLTIDDEQILVSAMSITAGVVTATIDTRGYNNTQAATHLSDATVSIHITKATTDAIMNHIKQFDEAGLIVPTGIAAVPAITSATVHTFNGADYTSYFVAGRVYFFKVSSTWYRAVVRSSSYGGGNTTVNISGDGLTGSGTILSIGFAFDGSIYGGIDYQLVKECTNVPAQNPPAGYNWLFTKAGGWYSKDSSGNVRFLTRVRATVSSSSGIVACDWSLADVYDITLTENVTQVTHSNGVEGQVYTLRIKQHASAAKTVALNTAGGTRFSNTYSGYTASTDLSSYDILEFKFNATDTKYDLYNISQGFQTSPSASTFTDYGHLFGDGSDGAVAMDGTNTYAAFASKSSGNYTLTRDVFATTLALTNNATLNTAGFRVYATVSVSVASGSTLFRKGGVGSDGSGGTGGAAGTTTGGSTPNGGAGAAGANGPSANGNNATNVTDGLGANGGAGGGSGSSSGGTGATVTAYSGAFQSAWLFEALMNTGTLTALKGGGGGGGGGSGNGGAINAGGGGGGGGGGVLWVSAQAITISSGGVAHADGGAGGRGSTSSNSGGGGGGGGGKVFFRYRTYTNSGTVRANGGAGGNFGSSGSVGTAGSNTGTAAVTLQIP